MGQDQLMRRRISFIFIAGNPHFVSAADRSVIDSCHDLRDAAVKHGFISLCPDTFAELDRKVCPLLF